MPQKRHSEFEKITIINVVFPKKERFFPKKIILIEACFSAPKKDTVNFLKNVVINAIN